MRLEAERVKAELEALKLEREAVARAEEADRIAAEEARRAKADEDAAEARRYERNGGSPLLRRLSGQRRALERAMFESNRKQMIK